MEEKLSGRSDPEDVEVANSIIPMAGNHLPPMYLDKFIQADISDAVALEEMAKHLSMVDRMRELLPSVLHYLTFEDQRYAASAAMRVYECSADFESIATQNRRDLNRRKMLEKLGKGISAVDSLLEQMDDLALIDGAGFHWAYEAYQRQVFNEPRSRRTFEDLKYDLSFLSYYLQLSLHRGTNDPHYLYVPDNQAKTHIVENAHQLSLAYDGPQLVTTPGSDFSVLCSLLYEIASGVRDESLAGAINRYSRSEDRKRAEVEEADFRTEQEEAENPDETDNFVSAKETLRKCKAEAAQYADMLEDPALPLGARVLVRCLALDAADRALEARTKYGPNLVWASQFHPGYLQRIWDESRLSRAQARKLKIELGQKRREARGRLT